MTQSYENIDDVLVPEESQLKAGNRLDHLFEKAQRVVQSFGIIEGRKAAGEELSYCLGRPQGKQLVLLCLLQEIDPTQRGSSGAAEPRLAMPGSPVHPELLVSLTQDDAVVA